MGYYDRTSYWDDSLKNVIYRCIPNAKKRVILGQSDNSEYQTKLKIATYEEIIISYNSIKQLFIIWNASVHRLIKPDGSYRLKANKYVTDALKNNFTSDSIYCYYNQIKDFGYEKILIVGIDSFTEFCENYIYYMLPIKHDDNYKSPALYADEYSTELIIIENSKNNEIFERATDIIRRKRRDKDFRKNILSKYNYTCLICGCKEVRLLEAAHILDVQYNGDDSDDNGLCLCSNHHKLYDSGLLNIDYSNNTFQCTSEAEKEMLWYKAAEENGFKLQYDL